MSLPTWRASERKGSVGECPDEGCGGRVVFGILDESDGIGEALPFIGVSFQLIGDALPFVVLELVFALALVIFSLLPLGDARLNDVEDEGAGEDEDGDEGAEVVDEGLPCGGGLLELLAFGVGLEDFDVAGIDLGGSVEEFGGFEGVVG